MLNIEEFAKSGRLFDDRYRLLYPLSTDGGTADVWLAIDNNTIDAPDYEDDDVETMIPKTDTGIKVAIKVYRPKNALDIEGEQRFRDEYKIVFNCHHTHLLQPINFSIFQDTPYLVLPFCSQGSSEAMVGQGISNDELWRYIEHVASGLAYLHALQPPIIHQDVKPANVLIDDNGNYTITDFGISAKFGGGRQDDNESSGTLAYMAPERFQEGYQPMAESDIWAVGATLYEIVTGKVPFGEMGGVNQMGNPQKLEYPQGLSSDIKKVIDICLDPNPKKRPTAEQLAAYGKAKKIPSKTWRIIRWTLLPLLLLVLGGVIWMQLSNMDENKVVLQPKPAKKARVIYREAMALVNSENPDSVKKGLEQLATIEDSTYVPALYELAFTYGCYSDTLSLFRKKILGIEVGNTNVDERALRNMSPYLPKEDLYNNKAMDLFRRIVEAPSDDVETKMNAAYRLGVYYLYYTRNVPLAQKYYKMCQEWALQIDDKDMQQMVGVALSEAH